MPQLPAGPGLLRALAAPDSLREILQQLPSVLPGQAGAVALIEPGGREPVFLVTTDGEPGAPRAWEPDPGCRDAILAVLAAGRPTVCTALPDLAACLGAPHALLLPLGARAPGTLVAAGLSAPVQAPALEAAGAIADACGFALEQARLRHEVEQHRQLRAVLDAWTPLERPDVGTGLHEVCGTVASLFGAARVEAWLHAREAAELVLGGTSQRLGDEEADGRRVPTSDRTIGAVLHARAPQVIGRTRGVSIAVPLRGHRRALGVLVIHEAHLAPGEAGALVARAEQVGRQLSPAIESASLIDEVVRGRRKLEDIFDAITDLVLVCDASGTIVEANPSAAARLGRTRADLRGVTLDTILGPALAAAARDALAAPGAARVSHEVVDEGLGGTFAVSMSPLGGPAATGLVIVARDVSDRVRLEAERADLERRLAQADKLAAIGQFVAGIAHELNNPLQGVLGLTELLRRGRVPAPIRRELRQIHREAERAAKIVRNLLVFTGARRLDRRRVRIGTIIGRVATLRGRALRARGIALERSLAPDLPLVHVDPLLLQQALLNIVVNAEQAMEGPGRIEMRATLTEAGTVRVAIHDTGSGIAADALPHVFEPFFTTKEVGVGTGLGLAIAYGIVSEHGGSLTAANAPDGGALLTLTLPAASRREPARAIARTRRTHA